MSDVLAYYAEAEPKLLKLRDKVPTMERDDVLRAITDLVGVNRYHKDFDAAAAEVPCPPERAPSLWALERWEKKYPRNHARHRIYGQATGSIVAEALGVLTPDEIAYFRKSGNTWIGFASWGYATKKPVPKPAA